MCRLCIHALLAAGCWVPVAGHASPVAEVVALRGQAVMVFAGKTTPLAIGTRLEQAAEVRTAAAGRVRLEFIDGSVLVIGDASTFKVDQFRIEERSGARRAGFSLDIGLISQTVSPSAGSWTVRTPSAVTAVRGTEYIIEVKPDLITEVNVKSGTVEVEPLPPRKKLRTRGLADSAGAPSVLLDGANASTSCDAEDGCIGAEVLRPEHMRALDDRLSGV